MSCPTRIVSTIRTSCKRASTTSAPSYSIENCPIRSFAKNHSEAARLILEPPPFSFDQVSSSRSPPFHVGSSNHKNDEQETLENYLKWRRWDIKIHEVLNEHNLGNDSFASAVGLLSHPLTFPLTLGRHIRHFHRPRRDDGKKLCRICCVGARSECTLPDEYWKELLIMTISEDLCDNTENVTGRDHSSETVFEWVIDFVGPDVPTQLKSKSISLFRDEELRSSPQCSLTMNYHTAFLHDLIIQLRREPRAITKETDISPNLDMLQTIHEYWDGFVLFNPGIGHPNLAKHWEATFQFLCSTHQPILLTAHSAKDAHRDMVAMENMWETVPGMGMGRDGYRVNPYASRMEYIDPIEIGEHEGLHVVRPNHSVLLL